MRALLISMGTTLFSCQNSKGDKQKIDGVEVIDSPKNITLGILLPEKKIPTHIEDTVYAKTHNQGFKEGKVKIIKSSKKKVTKNQPIHLTGDVAISPNNPNRETPIKKDFYNSSEVETLPSFPGGISKFYDFVTSNFKIPDQSKNSTARIIFSFIINTDGSLSDVKVLRGINKNLDSEALRVIRSSPNWIPGEQNGEKVRVMYTIPIKITATE